MNTNALESSGTTVRPGELPVGLGLAAVAIALVTYEFVVKAWMAPGSAEGNALAVAWPIFALYVGSIGCAALLAPRAVARVMRGQAPSRAFSLASLAGAGSGVAMYLAIGAGGIGADTMGFYWGGLALLWSGSIAMVYACRYVGKPLAVRDWTLYAVAMALIPLTMIPSLPLWPLLFDLDPGQTLMTAGTSSFAAHMLLAHYVIFEILERRPRTGPR